MKAPIFIRPLTDGERRQIQAGLHATDAFVLRRCQILLAHKRQVKQTGSGVRILPFRLPIQSPWLNPIEPKWVHGKRQVVERDGVLSAQQLAERICAYFGCSYEPHLVISENVA